MSAHRVLKDLYAAFTKNIGPGLVEDPGNAGTITFDKWGQICELESGGSNETRTLANPDRAGVLATVRLATDGGGDVVVTASNGLNPSNETVATFGDAGDRLTLLSVTKSAGVFRWDVLDGNVGTAISSTSPSASGSSTPSASASTSPSTSPSASTSTSPSASASTSPSTSPSSSPSAT